MIYRFYYFFADFELTLTRSPTRPRPKNIKEVEIKETVATSGTSFVISFPITPVAIAEKRKRPESEPNT